jgi:hypothetical protein
MHTIRHLAGCTGLAFASLASLALALAPATASAQIGKTFLVVNGAAMEDQAAAQAAVARACKGRVNLVYDLAFEGVKTTAWNFAAVGGGGIGGRFDPVPVLSTSVNLTGGCLNAHFSAMAGSTLYGVSNMTLFEITLTPAAGGPPVAMVGHYPTPYGIPSPAVALSAEYDVDMLGANFFQPVGTAPGYVPPGTYRLNVWWAGGPTAAGGAIGAAFVLKLYQQ